MVKRRSQMKRYQWLSIALAISFLSIYGLAATAVLWEGPPQVNTSDADSAAIRQAALDYIEGYYEGDAERMERAVHPELAKRIVLTDRKSGRSRLDQMSAMTLVRGTRAGGGKDTPKERQQKDVTILDIFEQAASVKIVASDWVDYLHLAKFNGRWVIVNVLWELKPEKK
jgi:Putative lumazine-binding